MSDFNTTESYKDGKKMAIPVIDVTGDTSFSATETFYNGKKMATPVIIEDNEGSVGVPGDTITDFSIDTTNPVKKMVITTDKAEFSTDLNDLQKNFTKDLVGNVTFTNSNDEQVIIENNAAKFISINSDISNLQTDITNIEGDIALIEAGIADLQGDVASLDGSITNINTGLTNINDEINVINGGITSIETDIDTNTTAITSINANITSIEDDITNLQNNLNSEVIDVLTYCKGDLSSTNLSITQAWAIKGVDNGTGVTFGPSEIFELPMGRYEVEFYLQSGTVLAVDMNKNIPIFLQISIMNSLGKILTNSIEPINYLKVDDGGWAGTSSKANFQVSNDTGNINFRINRINSAEDIDITGFELYCYIRKI